MYIVFLYKNMSQTYKVIRFVRTCNKLLTVTIDVINIFFLLICIFVHNHFLYVLKKKKQVHYSLVAGILILLDGHNESLAALNYFIYSYMPDFHSVT